MLDKSAPPPDTAFLAAYFDLDELVCADVSDGEARIWSNFQVHPDGFGRLLMQDLGLKSSADTSRLLQRLQELGNYGTWRCWACHARMRPTSNFPLWSSGWPT